MPPVRLAPLPFLALLAGCAVGAVPPEGAAAAARGAPPPEAPRPAATDVAMAAASAPESCAAIEAEMSDPTIAAEMIRATREGMQAMRGLGAGGQVARTALGVAAGFIPFAGGVVGAVLDGVEGAGRLAAQERMNASLDAMLLRQETLLTRYGAAGCHRQGDVPPAPPSRGPGLVPGREVAGEAE